MHTAEQEQSVPQLPEMHGEAASEDPAHKALAAMAAYEQQFVESPTLVPAPRHLQDGPAKEPGLRRPQNKHTPQYQSPHPARHTTPAANPYPDGLPLSVEDAAKLRMHLRYISSPSWEDIISAGQEPSTNATSRARAVGGIVRRLLG